MKKETEESKKKKVKLINVIIELRDNILEEYDMMELVEDSIKYAFQCDLDCATCSTQEQGICLQNFKKGNLFWLRKIAQDEAFIKDIVVKLDDMVTLITDLYKQIKEELKTKDDGNLKDIEDFETDIKQKQNKPKTKIGYNGYYT
jgi:hypothetical protein